MTRLFKQLPIYFVIGSMGLSGCSVVARGPHGPGPYAMSEPPYQSPRVDPRPDYREPRPAPRYEERRDERREDRYEDRRADRRDWKEDRGDDRRDDRREDHRGDMGRPDARGNMGRDDRRADMGGNAPVRYGAYFADHQREQVRDYYRRQRQAHCPPGLARKNNGCQPPGHARKWSIGQPLPRDVAYHPVDPEVRVQIGMPPHGYEFVQVATDVLMIAVGTAVVVDAIQDLNGR